LKNPELIILDEATSALDTTTEFHIKQVIDTAFEEKTMLIIAHRLSTIQQADRVVVLKD
jgi:ABC-type multidrug transport system fused ATPase/permease subunit